MGAPSPRLTPSPRSTDLQIISKTLRGASLQVGSQGLSRLLTFFGNVALVRVLNDAQPLGLASTQLHLLYVAALTLSREGVRRACLRELAPRVELGDETKWNKAAALSRTYTVMAGVFLTPVVFYYFFTHLPRDVPAGDLEEYRASLWIVAVGSLMELASEPMYVVAQACSMFELRSGVEAMGAISRASVGLFTAYFFGARVSAFAWGYLATGCTIFVGFAYGLARRSPKRGFHLPVDILFGHPHVDFGLDLKGSLGRVAALSSIQAGWKLALSEGEKLVMLALGTVASDRGSYAMAANLGSLAARLVLQPCEEAAFSLFGKLKNSSTQVELLLGALTRASVVFALVFSCFATNFTHFLVFVLYGRAWADDTETPYILSWYCLYIAVCAVNGMTEAFLQALADETETKSFNAWLLMCSIAFVFYASIFLPWMGTAGLVAANILVMLGRIVRNLSFAKKKYPNCHLMPPSEVMMLFAFGFVATWFTKNHVYNGGRDFLPTLIHVGVGAFAGLLCLSTVYFRDRRMINTLTGPKHGDPAESNKLVKRFFSDDKTA